MFARRPAEKRRSSHRPPPGWSRGGLQDAGLRLLMRILPPGEDMAPPAPGGQCVPRSPERVLFESPPKPRLVSVQSRRGVSIEASIAPWHGQPPPLLVRILVSVGGKAAHHQDFDSQMFEAALQPGRTYFQGTSIKFFTEMSKKRRMSRIVPKAIVIFVPGSDFILRARSTAQPRPPMGPPAKHLAKAARTPRPPPKKRARSDEPRSVFALMRCWQEEAVGGGEASMCAAAAERP